MVYIPAWRRESDCIRSIRRDGDDAGGSRLAGARGIGVDIDPTYIETAQQRLEQAGDGAVDVTLNHDEIQELLKQDPDTEKDGGWQGLLVGLQKRTNKTTGHLTVTAADLEQI